MRQKILFNVLAILIALGLVFSISATVFYLSYMREAESTDCNEAVNSALTCGSSIYREQFMLWCFGALLLMVVAVLFSRLQTKKQRKM